MTRSLKKGPFVDHHLMAEAFSTLAIRWWSTNEIGRAHV